MRLLACALLALCLGAAHALYDKDGPVALLSTRTFSKVRESNLPVVVEFFAPWCGHCKALAPAFTKAASKLQHIVPFVAVDCDAEKNRPLCAEFGVQGFPTIKLFKSGKSASTDYMGERSAKALVDAATALLSAKRVKGLKSDAEAAKWLEDGGEDSLPRVLLFSDKAQPSPLYKSLAARFDSKLLFAELGTGASETASQFGVTSRPTLVVRGPHKEHTTYTGELKPKALIDFLKKFQQGGKAGSKPQPEKEHAEHAQAESKESKENGTKSKGKSKVAELPHVVKNVTLSEVESKVLSQEGVSILAFYAGSNEACTAQLDQLNQAVHGLDGLAKAVQVHLGTPEDLASATKQYPALEAVKLAGESCHMQLFLLPFEDKDDSDEWKKFEFEGEKLSSKELHRALLPLFPDRFVTFVTSQTLQAWWIQNPEDIKVVLFSDKEEVPGVLRALSSNLRNYPMHFAMAPASDEGLKQQFKVDRTPFIMTAYPKPEGLQGETVGSVPKGKVVVEVGLQPYFGPMKYGHIARFMQIMAIQLGKASKEAMDELLGGMQRPAPSAEAAAAAVPQLSSPADFKAACLDKGGICIIAALPPQTAAAPSSKEEEESSSADSDAAPEQGGEGSAAAAAAAGVSPELAALRAAALRRGRQEGLPLHFSWVDASRFPAFARGLGVSDPGVRPALVALAPKKQRYAVYGGELKEEAVEAFLAGLLSGSVTTAPLQVLPELVEGPEQQEEAPPVIEEEFDLADIMKEEVEGEVASAREERLAAEAAAAEAAAGGKKKKKKSKSKKPKDEL